MEKTTTLFIKSISIVFLLTMCFMSVNVFGQKKAIAEEEAAIEEKIKNKTLTQREKEILQIYPGFVVTAKHNDTLHGEIRFFNPTYNEMTVVFYKNGEKIQYYPSGGEIREYSFQYKKYSKLTGSIEPHWFTYIRKLVPNSPIKGGAKEVFVERQVYGDITLYNYYTLKTSKINSRKYKHNYFIEKEGTDGFTLKTITHDNYRDMVRQYLVLGNDELEENLGTAGFGYKYLSKLVSIQNAWQNGSPEYNTMMAEAKGKARKKAVPATRYADMEDDQ